MRFLKRRKLVSVHSVSKKWRRHFQRVDKVFDFEILASFVCILADTKVFAPAGATKGLSDRSATLIVAALRRSFRLKKAGTLSREAGRPRKAQPTGPP